VYYRCSYHDENRVAIVSPAENIKWTYSEFWKEITQIAGALTKAGYHTGSIVRGDSSSALSNLLLQMAAAHNGMQVALGTDVPVDGSMTVAELKDLGGKAGEGASDRDADLAYYHAPEPTSNRQAYLHGAGIAGLLQIKPTDQVCVSASLDHVFGVGAVISAIARSATVYFPPAPADIGDSSLIITDQTGYDAVGGVSGTSLRGGLVKNIDYRSSIDIPMVMPNQLAIDGTSLYGLSTKGKSYLFDPCKDTFWPVQ
jgi:hypothetical protein